MRFIQRLAKFANYDQFANPVFDRGGDGAMGTGLRPNTEFLAQEAPQPVTKTLGSRMNDMPDAKEDGFGGPVSNDSGGDNAPF